MPKFSLKILVFACVLQFTIADENIGLVKTKTNSTLKKYAAAASTPVKNIIRFTLGLTMELLRILFIPLIIGFFVYIYQYSQNTSQYFSEMELLQKYFFEQKLLWKPFWPMFVNYLKPFGLIYGFVLNIMAFGFLKSKIVNLNPREVGAGRTYFGLIFLVLLFFTKNWMHDLIRYDTTALKQMIGSVPSNYHYASFILMILFVANTFEGFYTQKHTLKMKDRKVSIESKSTQAALEEVKTEHPRTNDLEFANKHTNENLDDLVDSSMTKNLTKCKDEVDKIKQAPQTVTRDQSTNWTAYLPIGIPSFLGVVILACIYYKCCRGKSELGSDVQKNKATARMRQEGQGGTRKFRK